LWVDKELVDLAKKMNVNLSQLMENAIKTKLLISDKEDLDQLIQKKIEISMEKERKLKELDEKDKKERKEIEELYDNQLKIIEEKLTKAKEEKKQEEQIKSHPEIQEAIRIVAQNPDFLEGRLRLIEKRTGLKVPKDLFMRWVNEYRSK